MTKKDVNLIVTFEVPDETDPDDVLFELRGYLPDVDRSGTWRLASVELKSHDTATTVEDTMDYSDPRDPPRSAAMALMRKSRVQLIAMYAVAVDPQQSLKASSMTNEQIVAALLERSLG